MRDEGCTCGGGAATCDEAFAMGDEGCTWGGGAATCDEAFAMRDKGCTCGGMAATCDEAFAMRDQGCTCGAGRRGPRRPPLRQCGVVVPRPAIGIADELRRRPHPTAAHRAGAAERLDDVDERAPRVLDAPRPEALGQLSLDRGAVAAARVDRELPARG